MHARVSLFQFQPGTAAEALNIVQHSILPDARTQAGFCGAWGLRLPTTDQGLVITLWASEAELLASKPGAHYATQTAQLARLDDLVAAAPVQQVYEVQFHLEPEGAR